MRYLLLPPPGRLLALLALLSLPFAGIADESLNLSATQIKSLRIASRTVDVGSNSGGSALPARVLVPTAQMRILAAPVAGTIEMLAVAPGSSVRRGEALARMASPEALTLQRDALQAASQANLLQESLRRDETLFKEGLIAESRLQATRAAAAQAAAQAGERRQGLALAGVAPGRIGGPLTLLSPIDGVILEQGAQLGQRVETAALIYRIARLSPLWLEAQLPVSRLGDVRIGQSVRIAGSDITGKVSALGRAVDTASQSVLLRASVERDAERLVPGQALEIVLAESGSPGLQVPSAAIIRYESQTLVFIETDGPDQGKRYQPRPVRIVQQGGDSALIEGVRPGERVVVSGSAALKAMLAGVGKS